MAALEKPGCPVCRLIQEAETVYVQRVLYDYVNDGLTRLGFVHSQGWCPDHAWLLQASEQLDWGNGHKVGIIYESLASLVEQFLTTSLAYAPPSGIAPLIPPLRASRGRRRWITEQRERVARWFAPKRQQSAAAFWLSAQLAPCRPCPVCEAARQKEALLLDKLAKATLDPEFRASLRKSDGLCLPHLRGALSHSSDEEASRYLVRETEEHLRRLLSCLRSAMDKRRKRDAPPLLPEEQVAWIRMIAFFAGESRERRTTDAVRIAREKAREQYAQAVRQDARP